MYHTLPAVLPLQRRQRRCIGRSNLRSFVQQQQQVEQILAPHKKYSKTAKEKRSNLTADKMTNNHILPSLTTSNKDNVDSKTVLTTTTTLSTNNNNNNDDGNIAQDTQKEEKQELLNEEQKELCEKQDKAETSADEDAARNNKACVKQSNKSQSNMQNINRMKMKSGNNSSPHTQKTKADWSNTFDNYNTCDYESNNVAEEFLLRDGVCYTPSTKRNLHEYEVFLQTPNYSTVKPAVNAVSHHGGCLEYNDPWSDKSGCYNRTVAACHIRNAHLKHSMPQNKEKGKLYHSHCVIKMSSSPEELQEEEHENHESLQYGQEERMHHEQQVKEQKRKGCHVHTEIMSFLLVTPETHCATQNSNSFEQSNNYNNNLRNIQHIGRCNHNHNHRRRRLSEEWLAHDYAPSVDPYNVQPFRGRCGYSDFNLRFNLTQPDARSAMYASPAERFRTTSSVPLKTPNK